MKICLAQTRPIKGDIPGNIERHTAFLEQAAAHGAGLVIFPELSITGYEPALAQKLATGPDDPRFDVFQSIADSRRTIIGIGVPTHAAGGIQIGMILFEPGSARAVYSKEFIHANEGPFFIRGRNSIGLIGGEARIALAICYELSIPEHSERAAQQSAKIYLASVAKAANGVENARKTLSEIARKYSMTTLMCNCVGPCDNFVAAGGSAGWNPQGEMIGHLDDRSEGILLLDTEKSNFSSCIHY